MAIDYGDARIGVALSDPTGLFARPYCILKHRNIKLDLQALQEIASENAVSKIVVGLPTSSDGGFSRQAEVVIRWAGKLARYVKVPIVFWDESFSSVDARELTEYRKKSAKLLSIDHIAAAVLLQEYLLAGGVDGEPGTPFETVANRRG